MRILIVEDEILVALGVIAFLEDEGHEPLGPFVNGPDAVRAALDQRPDLILMDVNLGPQSFDGVEAARRIREKSDTPVIFVTAYAFDPELRARMETTGPLAVLSKPLDERRLTALIAGMKG